MKCLSIATFAMLSALIPPKAIGQDGSRITQADASSGASHSCAVTAAGAAYCWGGTRSQDADGPLPAGGGQLGDGTNTDSNVPVAVSGGLFPMLEDGDDPNEWVRIDRVGMIGNGPASAGATIAFKAGKPINRLAAFPY